MNKFASAVAAFALAAAALMPGVSQAQITDLPPSLQSEMARVGAHWGADIKRNIPAVVKAYTPLLASAPKAGVAVHRDLPFGADPRLKLDVYQPETAKSGDKLPVVVFFHGGGLVTGDKNINAELYGNVPLYFARNGMLGVNATYRLAPGAKWPQASLDVGQAVAWLKANAARFGGDPSRIYLVGHSSGGTHIASYAWDSRIYPKGGPGVAGLVLLSARLVADNRPDDPNAKGVEAYYGTDRAQYADRAPLAHAVGSRIPVFIVIAEHDNPFLDVYGARLFESLCQRDEQCPRFTRLMGHNHMSEVASFNTADDTLGREILDFIRSGK